jgi:hypothetical protein
LLVRGRVRHVVAREQARPVPPADLHDVVHHPLQRALREAVAMHCPKQPAQLSSDGRTGGHFQAQDMRGLMHPSEDQNDRRPQTGCRFQPLPRLHSLETRQAPSLLGPPATGLPSHERPGQHGYRPSQRRRRGNRALRLRRRPLPTPVLPTDAREAESRGGQRQVGPEGTARTGPCQGTPRPSSNRIWVWTWWSR